MIIKKNNVKQYVQYSGIKKKGVKQTKNKQQTDLDEIII